MISLLSSRFAGRDKIEYIRDKITIRPDPVFDIDGLHSGVAAEKLFEAWTKIFIPNKFTLDFISEMVGRAAAHSATRFDTEPNYIREGYHPTEGEVYPICLTGLAGVGKSQTINALLRVMPEPGEICVDHCSSPLPTNSYWYETAREKASGRKLLAKFLGYEKMGRTDMDELRQLAQRKANWLGISLTILEEMQFLNLGQGVTKTTDILLKMSGLNIPMIYVCNFSLGHKLFTRNSEDRQRLLSEPRVMLPDAPNSPAWSEFITECIRVSNGRIRANFENLSWEIYRSSFGIKRSAVLLLKLAYLEARKEQRMYLGIEDIHRAYTSPAYCSNRDDVEELERQAIQPNSKKRRDLRCPFGTPMRSTVVALVRTDRDNRVAQAAFKGALTAGEREAHSSLQLRTDPKSLPPKKKKRTRLQKPTNESLLNNYVNILDPVEK